MRTPFTLRSRLVLGVVGIALVLSVPLALSIHALRQVQRTTLELRNAEFAASLLLGRLRGGTDELRRTESAVLFIHDSASLRRMHAYIDSVRWMADSLDAYDLNAAATDVRLTLDSLTVQVGAEFNAAAASDVDEAELISSKRVLPRIGIIEQTITASEQTLQARTLERVDAATEATATANTIALATVVVAIVLAALIAIWMIRSISRPVLDLEAGMKKVSAGDFSHTLSIPPGQGDEFGRLSASFHSMSHQLADLDRLKAEFVSIASHELKTPINVILGYVELLQEGIYGRLNEAQRDVCGTIATQAHSLTKLARRLLDVSRFEAGGGKIECRTMNLPSFLDTLETSFNVLAMQRGVQFMVERSEGLPIEVRWDEDRMGEVLGNLLSNAFKFTSRGGKVTLRAQEQEDQVTLVVSDTGAGIPADQLTRVFAKFYQADNQTKASVQGTGLGLAIAKYIVEAHLGTISADSEIGKGTTFTIILPAKVDLRLTGQFAGVPPAAG